MTFIINHRSYVSTKQSKYNKLKIFLKSLKRKQTDDNEDEVLVDEEELDNDDRKDEEETSTANRSIAIV